MAGMKLVFACNDSLAGTQHRPLLGRACRILRCSVVAATYCSGYPPTQNYNMIYTTATRTGGSAACRRGVLLSM